MSNVLSRISDNWFLTEPLLFNILCTHTLVPNSELTIPFRTGKMRIEYHPDIIESLPAQLVEDYLKFEVIRILLKHPYQRQPSFPMKEALKYASDATINDTKLFDYSDVRSANAAQFKLQQNLSFEEYYSRIKRILENLGDQEQEAAESAELWEENEESAETINLKIDEAIKNQMWGSVAGTIKEQIVESQSVKMDYRRIISMFRTSILTTKRTLTRMKPNRRYDFEYMGSRFSFITRLLVAVDVSGSITDENLQNFFAVINRFFKYGIESLDVIQFDAEISGKPVNIKKAQKKMQIQGGGGTDFQPPIDYFLQSDYDGLIVFTDGYAQIPVVKKKTNILWIFTSQKEYEQALEWVNKLPGSKATFIP